MIQWRDENKYDNPGPFMDIFLAVSEPPKILLLGVQMVTYYIYQKGRRGLPTYL